jgi:uncharacterized protein YndB with AHSA1/START domain
MSKPSFVYVTYIVTTPDKLFNALIDPEMTRRYWCNHRNESDWRVGSAWRHQDYDDANEIDVAGTVLENDPPRRLVVSWANPGEEGDSAKCSRVTFDLEQLEKSVRLTVMHDELEPDSQMLRGITFGWPAVLSSLKTFIETGDVEPNLWSATDPAAALAQSSA